MFKKNKRGIELAINFIVMLIMAIAVFSGGLLFAGKFFRQAGATKAVLDTQAQRQIEALLNDGSPVVLPVHTKTIRRSKYDTFALGILNIKSDAEHTFTIDPPVFTSAVEPPPSKKIVCTASKPDGCGALPTIQMGKSTATLKKNEKTSIMILVDVGSTVKRANYLYKITVKDKNDDVYDFPVQMIVKVP